MSRCFPFPPPGYMIKLRFDLDTPKKDRKKKNRKEDKNERKEKREKRKREKELKQKDSTTSHANYENEQLERSGITEELEQPVSSPQEPYSSDSTQSSKRKRCTLLPNQDHEDAIKTRLPLTKHSEPEKSKQGFQFGSCSTSVGIGDSLTQETRRIDRPLTKVETPNQQLHRNSASKVCKPLQNLVPVDALEANKTVDDESRCVESLYKSLLHIQPIAYELFDALDQDWLFSSVKIEAKHVSKKQKTDAFRCSKSLWPRAQFMPEVNILALPYTIPF
ncbi:uncharacterized protein [Medicago truncatula]|uniref:uncharacterized protein n=1 Tax=Medicago truncatula TaxID=3880 RepID=UPI000D2F3A7C|nr:uncharacterized protein LOC11434357 [Medicago truncatula]